MREINTYKAEDVVSKTLAAIEDGILPQWEAELFSLSDAELANLIESLPPQQRAELWESCPKSRQSELLPHLHDEVRTSIIGTMEDASLLSVVQACPRRTWSKSLMTYRPSKQKPF